MMRWLAIVVGIVVLIGVTYLAFLAYGHPDNAVGLLMLVSFCG